MRSHRGGVTEVSPEVSQESPTRRIRCRALEPFIIRHPYDPLLVYDPKQ
jgi:hypothetical protein